MGNVWKNLFAASNISFPVEEKAGRPLSPQHLFDAVIKRGECVCAHRTRRGIVHSAIERRGARIVMTGSGGLRTLNVAATDADRLHAQWQAYKQASLRIDAQYG